MLVVETDFMFEAVRVAWIEVCPYVTLFVPMLFFSWYDGSRSCNMFRNDIIPGAICVCEAIRCQYSGTHIMYNNVSNDA
jgi:hypothetical protein